MVSCSVNLSESITESFFTKLEKLSGSNTRLRKRLTEVTLEMFQNICRHSLNLHQSTLVIQKDNTACCVAASNTIASDDVEGLRKKINYLNSLDRDQLKRQHTKILATSKLSRKSGAGLGLYRLALRSDSRLISYFSQLDKNHFTFSLHVTLNNRS